MWKGHQFNKFNFCPICEQHTDFVTNAEPASNEEVKKYMFEGFYKHHDEARQGPTPEEKGTLEGIELAEKLGFRDFRRTLREIRRLPTYDK